MPAPRMTIDQLPEDTAVSGSEWLMVQDGGASKKVAVNSVIAINQVALSNHITAAADAHDASAISALTSSPTINGVSVQAQLGQLAGEVTGARTTADTAATDIAAHVGDTSAAHNASAVAVTTIAGVAGTDVQAVLAELAARITALET